MITGSLQVKNDTYYAVLNLYVDGRRRPKWISTNLPVRGNKRKAESVLNELINEYETNIAFSTGSAGADQMFLNYLYSWLENARSSIAIMTYTEEALLASLDEKQKRLFQAFTDAQTEITLASEVGRFVYGYRLGALMTMEIFEGKEDLIVGGT